MTVIKRKLIKAYYYSRKSPNKAIDLEKLGLNDTYDSTKTAVHTMSDKVIERINLPLLAKISRYLSNECDRIILSETQIEETLHVMLNDVFTNYYATKETALYRGEYFSVMITLNRNGKHILVIFPNMDIL